MKIIDNEEKMTPEEAVEVYQAEAEPEQPAKGDSAPAPKAEAKEEPPAARDELVDKLRVAHVAVHAIMLLVLFWFSFRENYANGANIYIAQGGITAVFSYITSYAFIIALLAAPGVIMAPALTSKGLMADRFAMAAAALDAMIAFTMLGFSAAMGMIGGFLLGAVYLALAAVALMAVMKRA